MCVSNIIVFAKIEVYIRVELLDVVEVSNDMVRNDVVCGWNRFNV